MKINFISLIVGLITISLVALVIFSGVYFNSNFERPGLIIYFPLIVGLFFIIKSFQGKSPMTISHDLFQLGAQKNEFIKGLALGVKIFLVLFLIPFTIFAFLYLLFLVFTTFKYFGA